MFHLHSVWNYYNLCVDGHQSWLKFFSGESNNPFPVPVTIPLVIVFVSIISRSQTTITISAWGSILKSGVDLPWSGTAYVKCDGAKKVLAKTLTSHESLFTSHESHVSLNVSLARLIGYTI